MHKTILIIEDDAKIANLIQLYLEKEGYRVLLANEGNTGLTLALKVKPDLMVLDRMLPNKEGLEVLRELRKIQETPVLILSAKADEMEKIIGLEVGADDYLSKPFSPKELVARVKAILRRAHPSTSFKQNLTHQDLNLDPERMQVTQSGRIVPLSALEFKLLYTMVKKPGTVFTREHLIEEIYESSQDIIFDRTIDAHIKNIRKKLNDSPKQPRYLAAVFGVGYKILDHENHSSF